MYSRWVLLSLEEERPELEEGLCSKSQQACANRQHTAEE